LVSLITEAKRKFHLVLVLVQLLLIL